MREQHGGTSPLILFYSYAPEDEPLCNELDKHLSLLQRRGIITTWHNRQIVPGADWARTIDSHLKEAAIILLLISPDFLASDYCYSKEMQLALKRNEQGLAQVIPILLRPVDWQDAPFAHLQSLPSNQRPVTLWESRDAAFLDVVSGIRAAITRIGSPTTQSVSRPLSSTSQRNRQRLLKRVRAFWIEGMLEQSLHQAALIALGLQHQPDALANPWRLMVQDVKQTPRPLPTGTRITQVYDQADGALLILGEPGSGKTTLLLELARDLLDRAERDESYPMPVVFNLSSWAVKRLPLADWLAEELKLRYQVPLQLAQSWISSDSILPLLDGLDEVTPTHRVACLEAINAYRGEHNLVSLVVCSRSKEYFSQKTRILLHSAVTIQPLTLQQIDEYLRSAGEQLITLHTTIHEDEVLQKLATSPLILSILTLTYHGKTVEELTTTESPQKRRRQIFAAYVQRMFEHRGIAPSYTPQQTIKWLSWLASQMALHQQTEFHLESMQPDWLWQKPLRQCYEWLVGRPMLYILRGLLTALMSGVLALYIAILVNNTINKELFSVLISVFPVGVLFSVENGLRHGWRKGLYTAIAGILAGGLAGVLISKILTDLSTPLMCGVVGLVAGMMIGLLASVLSGEEDSGINVRPVFGWSWEEVAHSLKAGGWKKVAADMIVFIVIVPAFAAVVAVQEGVFSGLSVGGVQFLAILLLFIFHSGVQSSSLSKQIQITPNQGIYLSARQGFYACIAEGLYLSIAASLIYIPAGLPMSDGIFLGLIVGLFGGIFTGFSYGWDACVRHLVLRLLLWHAGSLPKNYSHFLDYAAERIFLHKIGGSYIFIHRLLLEYFALLMMETETIQMVNFDAKDATIYHKRGLIFAEFSEHEQAITSYTRAIELNPKEVSFYEDRGQVYAKCEKHQQAIVDFTSAIHLDPTNAWTYYQRGFAYSQLDEYEKAIADFTQAIRLGPAIASYYNERGVAYRSNQEYEKAIADFNEAIRLEQATAEYYNERGLTYRLNEEYEQAIADFTRAAELASEDAWTYRQRGIAYSRLGEYEKAITDFTEMIRLEPAISENYHNRGLTYHLNKEYEKAITDFTETIRLEPATAEYYNDRGLAYRLNEEYEKAIADFTQAAELAPEDAWTYYQRGIAYSRSEEYEKAIIDLTEAIRLEPAIAEYYGDRGLTYLWNEEYEKAIADFTEAIRLKPEIAEIHFDRGVAHGLNKEYEKAVDDYSRAIELDTKHENAYFNRGYEYLWLKNSELACADFSKCVSLQPEDVNAAWMLVYTSFNRQPPRTEVVELLEAIAELDSQSDEACLCRGIALGLRGKPQEGLIELEQALHLNPASEDAWFWKGMMCAYLGQRVTAMESIERALQADLPPLLLTPLFWLEHESPQFYQEDVIPLLQRYELK